MSLLPSRNSLSKYFPKGSVHKDLSNLIRTFFETDRQNNLGIIEKFTNMLKREVVSSLPTRNYPKYFPKGFVHKDISNLIRTFFETNRHG